MMLLLFLNGKLSNIVCYICFLLFCFVFVTSTIVGRKTVVVVVVVVVVVLVP